MVLKEVIGHLKDYDTTTSQVETIWLEWYEAGKKLLHKKTDKGREIVLKRINQAGMLLPGDIMHAEHQLILVIDILPSDAIVITPSSIYEMAAICYEIGNRHMPLFYLDDHLVIPYEAPMFQLLMAAGYNASKEKRKLFGQMKTSVLPHQHAGSSSLFSKILQLTNAGHE